MAQGHWGESKTWPPRNCPSNKRAREGQSEAVTAAKTAQVAWTGQEAPPGSQLPKRKIGVGGRVMGEERKQEGIEGRGRERLKIRARE